MPNRSCKGYRLVLRCLLLLSGLTACEQQVRPETSAAPPETPSPPAAPAPVQRTYVTALAWAFRPGEQCTASASGKAASLAISATDAVVNWRLQGRMLAQARHQRVQLRFSAVNASWALPARRLSDGHLLASTPLSEKEAARVLVLLGGGTLTVGDGANAPVLKLPPAGREGADWFTCVRDHLLPPLAAP